MCADVDSLLVQNTILGCKSITPTGNQDIATLKNVSGMVIGHLHECDKVCEHI